MKCPKYIKEAIMRRANAAQSFIINDIVITKWCDKNEVDTEYIAGYIDCIMNPYESARFILEDIKRAGEQE